MFCNYCPKDILDKTARRSEGVGGEYGFVLCSSTSRISLYSQSLTKCDHANQVRLASNQIVPSGTNKKTILSAIGGVRKFLCLLQIDDILRMR